MRPFDQDGDLQECFSETRTGDALDVTAYDSPKNVSKDTQIHGYLTDSIIKHQTPIWDLSSFANEGTSFRSTIPLSQLPVTAPPSSRQQTSYQPLSGHIDVSQRNSEEQKQDFTLPPIVNREPTSVLDHNARHMLQSHESLEAQNAYLLHALAQLKATLHSAQREARDLAAWALQDRVRLMTEAQHQRLLCSEYEAMLRQRDEQVTYLLALSQEAKLDHARSLVREGEAMGRPGATECVQRINQMRAQFGLPLIDRYGAFLDALVVEEDNQIGGESQHVLSGLYAFKSDEGVADEEGSYSPPDSDHPVSIDAQIDELIAEEKGRFTGW